VIIEEGIGIDLQKVGHANRHSVLRIIQNNKQISQIDIASVLNLSQSAVSRYSKQLIDEGYVKKAGLGISTGGRKPVFLEINPKVGYMISVEISRTGFNYAVFDFCENMILHKKQMLRPDSLVTELTEIISGCIENYDEEYNHNLCGIALGVRGYLDSSTGTIIYSGALHLNNMPLKQIIEERFQVPVFIDSHTRFEAMGEMTQNTGGSMDNFVYLSVSWGMSMSGFINGALIRGKGNAGEIGMSHLLRGAPGRLVQQYCAGSYIIEQILENWESPDNRYLKALYPENPEELLLAHVVKAVFDGDEFAARYVRETARNLGTMVSNVIQIFDPEEVIIGGELSKFGDHLLIPLRESVRERLKEIRLEIQFDQVRIRLTDLIEKSCLIGGAHRIMENELSV